MTSLPPLTINGNTIDTTNAPPEFSPEDACNSNYIILRYTLYMNANSKELRHFEDKAVEVQRTQSGGSNCLC